MATTRANDLANFIGAPSFTGDLTVDSDFSANTITATTTVTGATVTSTGTVSGVTVSDSDGNVRTPRHTNYSGGDLTVSDEGVIRIASSATLTTLTLGTPAAGSIICVYNNKSSSITLACGSQIAGMRIGADNNTTHNATLTLGAYSITTITIVSNTIAVVTGTDVS